MKFITIALLALAQIGCSSSTDKSVNPLIGTWISNCHERIDATGTIISYTIRILNITENTFDVTTLDQIDISCTIPNGVAYVIPHTYTLGEQVITTDGVNAQRITLNSDFNLIPQPIKQLQTASSELQGWI